jgi:hypothetical protein
MNYHRKYGDLMRKIIILVLFGAVIILSGQQKPRVHHFRVSPAALYQTYNELYFDNKLPRKIEVLEEDVPDTKEQLMGLTLHTVGTHYYKIYISPTFNYSANDEEESTLHEACHVKVWEDREEDGTASTADPKDSHGKAWQDCMKRLAKQDAFWSIW